MLPWKYFTELTQASYEHPHAEMQGGKVHSDTGGADRNQCVVQLICSKLFTVNDSNCRLLEIVYTSYIIHNM